MHAIDKTKAVIVNLIGRLGYTLLRNSDFQAQLDERAKNILRRDRYITHNMSRGYPQVPYVFVPFIEATREDVAIAERLLKFYRRAREEETATEEKADAVWPNLASTHHREFLDLLSHEDPVMLAAHLCNMSAHSITTGLSQGNVMYDILMAEENDRIFHAAFFFDKLVSCAEAMGCLPVESPEQGRWGVNICLALEEVVEQIEKAISIEVSPSPFLGGLFGLPQKKGVMDLRFITAIYTAWEILQLLDHPIAPTICEIGAGIGYVCNIAFRLGVRDYTIFDLPYVAVLAAYYLIKSLPEARIILYGEEDRGDAAIRLYPFRHFQQNKFKRRFDLVLNQDSFPELDRVTLQSYLDSICTNSKRYFLSINQEAQASLSTDGRYSQHFIADILGHDPRYKRMYRFPFWMRQGYTEELYELRR